MAARRTIGIDFSACEPKTERVYITFGSSAYEISGKEGLNCVLKYGGKVQDPNWSDNLTTVCLVPATVGLKEFEVKDLAIDFSPIDEFCGGNDIRDSRANYGAYIALGIFVLMTAVFIIAVKKRLKKTKKI